MSEIKYNGDVVNSVASEIDKIGNQVGLLSTDMQKATTKIISANGFSEYIGGVTSDSFSSAVDECETAVSEFVSAIRNQQILILGYSGDENAIKQFLSSLSRKEFDKLDFGPLEDYITVDLKAGKVLSSAGATLLTLGAGVVEGVLDFVETGADLIVLAGTGVASVFTGLYDWITGSHVTEDMWEGTKAFVSDKKVESIFDSFYANTTLGRYMKDNAYGFDTVRGIGKGVGYTVGVVAVTALTFGAGGATITAGNLATTAGLMGFSNGTEEAWADGASTLGGLSYGALSGAWEAAQWGIGAKINAFGGQSLSGIAKRVALDTADSAVEGFVQPALSMVYKDYGGSNFGENYARAFESAGGWGNVGTQAAIGAFASAAGEASGLRKLLKDGKNSSADIDASAIGEGGVALLGAGSADRILKSSDAAVKALPEHIDDSARSIAKNADGSIKALPEHIDTSAKSIAKNADGSIKALPEHIDTSARSIAKNADTSSNNVARNMDGHAKNTVLGSADNSSRAVSNNTNYSAGTVTSSAGKNTSSSYSAGTGRSNVDYSTGTVTSSASKNTSSSYSAGTGRSNVDYSTGAVTSSAGKNADYSTGTVRSSASRNVDYSAESVSNSSSVVQHRASMVSSGSSLDNNLVYKGVDSSGSSSLAAASLYSSKGANVETKMSTSAAKIGESVSKVSSDVGTTFAAGTALGGSGVASLASLSDAKLALGDTSIKTSMGGSDITNISKTMDVSNSAKYDVDYVSKNSTSRVDGINSSSKTNINDSSLVTEKARTSKQLDADLRTLENKYDNLLDKRKNAVANYGEKSPQVAKLDKQIDQQFEKIKAKGKEKIAAQNAEYKSDLEHLTPEQIQKKYVGKEAKKTGAKLIQGDANINNPSAIEGNVSTNKVSSGSEVRPNWTDASAKVEGQIDGSALKKLPKDDVSLKSTDNTPKNNSSSLVTDKPRTSNQLDSDLRTLESKYDKLLAEKKQAIADYGENSPQVAKIDKKINKQMDKIIAKGKEKVVAQNAEYKTDLEKLSPEQVQKKYVGKEAKQTGAKLIQGDANINNPSAIEGNVSTNKVSSGGEVRPSWTDASAKVEGQIDGSALKKLPKDDVSLKSLDSDSGKVALDSGNKSTPLESGTGVQAIKDTKSEVTDSSLKFTSDDTIDSVAEKLDNAVERGSITREQADGMFEKAGEELHLAEKEKIVDLRKQNEQYELNKQANIDKKKQIVELDGAKSENIKGYDEAVRQIDDEISRNNMEIDSLQKKVSEASNSSSNVVNEIEASKADISDIKSDVEAGSIAKSVDTSGEYRLKGDELVDAKNYFDRKEFNQKYGIEDTEYKATGSNVSTDSVLNIDNMEKVDLNKTYRNLGQLYKIKDTELNVPGSKLNINNMEKVDFNKTYKNLGQLYKIKDTELNVPGSKLNVDSVANVDSIAKSVDTSGEYRLKGDELVDAKNYFDRKEFNQKYGIEDTEYKATGSNVSTDSVLNIDNMEKVDLNKTYRNLGQLYKIKDTELNVPGSKLNINNMEKVDFNKTYKNLGQLYKIKDTELNVPGSKLNVDSVANVDSIAKSVDTSGEYRLKGDELADAKNYFDRKEFDQKYGIKDTEYNSTGTLSDLDKTIYLKDTSNRGKLNLEQSVDSSGEYRLKGDELVDAKNYFDRKEFNEKYGIKDAEYNSTDTLSDLDKTIYLKDTSNRGKLNLEQSVDSSGEYRLKGDELVDAKNYFDRKEFNEKYGIKDTEYNSTGTLSDLDKTIYLKDTSNRGKLNLEQSVDSSGEYRLKENGINTEKAVTSIDEDNILVSQNKIGDYNSEVSKTSVDSRTLDANSIDSANKSSVNSVVEDTNLSMIGGDEIASPSATKLNITDESDVLSLKEMQVELDNLKHKIEDFGYGEMGSTSSQTLKELNDAYSKLSAKEQQASAALKEQLKLESKIDPVLEQKVLNGAPEYILGKDRPALSQKIIEDRVKAMGMHSNYQKNLYSGKIESWAEQFGVSYSEMEKIADAKVASFVNESQFGCRLNTDSLESCLDSGYIKNQFETGSSQAAIGMGDYKSNQRAIMEERMFGIPQDTPFSDRPVYGMAFPGDEKAFSEYLHHGPGKGYGDCVIIYNKDAIADSTSFVLGDSLTSSQYMSPSTVNNPKFSGAFHDFGADSLEEFKNADFFDTFNGDNGNILELQYHGQKAHAMNNTNIKEVVFESQPPKILQDKLGENGIPWRVVGDPEASVSMAKNMDISAPKTITSEVDVLDSTKVKGMSESDIAAAQKKIGDYNSSAAKQAIDLDNKTIDADVLDSTKVKGMSESDIAAAQKNIGDYNSNAAKQAIDLDNKTIDADALDSTKVKGMSESDIAAAQKNIGDYNSNAAKQAIDLDNKTIDADALDSTKVTGMSESDIAAAQKNIGDYNSNAAKQAIDLDNKTIDADVLDSTKVKGMSESDIAAAQKNIGDYNSSAAKQAIDLDNKTIDADVLDNSSKIGGGVSSSDLSTSVYKTVDSSSSVAKTATSVSSGDPNKVFASTSSPASSVDASTGVAKNVDHSTAAKTATSISSGDPNKVFASTSSPASSVDPSTGVAKNVDHSSSSSATHYSSSSPVKRYGVNQATDVVTAQKIFEAKYGNKYKYGVDYDFRFDSSGHVVVDWSDYKSYLAANKSHIDGINANVSSSQKIAADAYTGESKTLSYKTMNGVIRDNLLEYDANGKATGVVFHGLYGGKKSLSLKDYADFYGDVDEMLLKNKNAIFDLDDAIRSSTLDEPMVLYRGYQRIESCKRLFGFDPSKMTDKEICDSIMSKKGFLSEGFYSTAATKNASPIVGAKIVFEMNTKPGISALDMSKYGISSEEEILLASDIPFKYTGVRVEGSGYGRKIIVSCDFDEAYNPTVSRNLFRQKIDTNIDKMINSLKPTSSASIPTRISHTSYPSYINAKSFATTEEMVDHIKKNMSTDSTNISSIVGVINKHLDETNAKSGFSGPMYDDLLGMYDLGLSPERHSKVMDQVINSNHALREQISKGADFEISGMLNNLGITDISKVKEFKDAILGDDFIDGGIGKGADWNKFISLGEDSFKDKVQQGILNGKDPVLWSGFPTETHQLMDSKYTTISNTTIGEMPFVETVYSNWNGTGSPYKAEKLWGQLSTTYAQACCEAKDAAGKSLDSIKFLYPNTSDPTSCFGELFKTRELPEIVSYDEIHKISMAKTNPVTMEIEDVVDIDITSLCDYYYQHSGADEAWKDPALCNELFKMFNDLVKGAFNK